MITSHLEFNIQQNSYKVEDFRIGRFIDFERMKAYLSGGQYGNIFRMGTIQGDESLVMIDIEAFFTAFCPQALKDLKVSSFKDLGVDDYRAIKDVYIKQILPWYNDYLKSINPTEDKTGA